jgi:hypothetical protein
MADVLLLIVVDCWASLTYLFPEARSGDLEQHEKLEQHQGYILRGVSDGLNG